MPRPPTGVVHRFGTRSGGGGWAWDILAAMSPDHPTFPRVPGQLGMASVPQLLAAGWTRSALRHARASAWQEPMPRVVLPHRGPMDDERRLVAAGIWAGMRSVLSGGVALQRLGLRVRSTWETTFLVPETARARQHRDVRTVRTSRPPVVRGSLGVVQIAGAVRAVTDAAVHESHTAEDLQHLTISLLQRGLGTAEELEKELWLRPRDQVAPVWKGLEVFSGGAWSRPEGVLREIVDGDGGFPPLLTNCGLVRLQDDAYLGTPDGYLPEAGVAIQVHSRSFHQGIDDQGRDRWARTVEHDASLIAAGVRVIGVTPWTLYSRPARFVRNLRQVVQVGLAGPPPAVKIVPPRRPDGALPRHSGRSGDHFAAAEAHKHRSRP